MKVQSSTRDVWATTAPQKCFRLGLAACRAWCLLSPVALGLAGSVLAQPYQLETPGTNTEGATCGAGRFTLAGAACRTENVAITGGNYRLQGGLASSQTLVASSQSPSLRVRLTGDCCSITWYPPVSGFRLEQSSSLSSRQWNPAPAGNPVAVPLSDTAQFYRLRSP